MRLVSPVLGLIAVSLACPGVARAQAPAAAPTEAEPGAGDAAAPVDAAKPTTTSTSSPDGAPREKVRVLVLDLEAKGVDAATVETISGLVVVALAEEGENLDVIGGADVRNLVALEGERQAMGCSSDASCIAEIAGALGAELAVFGQVGKLGSLSLLTLSLFDTKAAKAVGRVSVEAKSDEELPAKTREAVVRLLATHPGVSRRAPTTSTPIVATTEGATATVSEDGTASVTVSASSDVVLWPFAVVGGGALLAFAGIAIAAAGYGGPAFLLLSAESGGDLDGAKTYQSLFALGVPTAAVYGGAAAVALGALVAVSGVGAMLVVGGEE